ncbi:MAG: stage III sporulation protein AF [Bacillota bacterium]|nr:stage III sporulation protein AF [Bacillota bacterium]
MDILYEIVRNLLVIIIISSFLELLLPEGQLKPFVRFTIGLFVIVAVLSPALTFLYDDRNFQVEYWNYSVDREIEKDILEKGEKIQEGLGVQSSSLVQEKVQGQISAVAMLVPGVDDVNTEVLIGQDGAVSSIHVFVSAQRNEVENVDQVNVFYGLEEEADEVKEEEIHKKIVQVLKNLYGIEEENITIQFEGGMTNAG